MERAAPSAPLTPRFESHLANPRHTCKMPPLYTKQVAHPGRIMTTRLLPALMLCLCSATLSNAQATAPTAAPPHITAIKAGRLIDVDAGEALSNQILLIRDNRFTAVGEAVEIPPGATVIDLSNMTVLPGLIDCHTHLADGARDPSGDPLTYLKRTAAEVALESERTPNPRIRIHHRPRRRRIPGSYRHCIA